MGITQTSSNTVGTGVLDCPFYFKSPVPSMGTPFHSSLFTLHSSLPHMWGLLLPLYLNNLIFRESPLQMIPQTSHISRTKNIPCTTQGMFLSLFIFAEIRQKAFLAFGGTCGTHLSAELHYAMAEIRLFFLGQILFQRHFHLYG